MKLFSLILVVGLLLQLWLPWWVIMLVPFAGCIWLAPTAARAFNLSFLAIFLIWLCASLLIHFRSGGLLTERVSDLLHAGSSVVLILITAFTGGLAAGFAGWAGYEMRLFYQRSRR
ncbi:MAG TPA: hypothetical protein VIR29_11035 [Anseongella sp.]